MSEKNVLGKIGTELLFENEYVRVWDLTLNPGEATDWHKHELDYMFVVISKGKVRTEYDDGSFENQDDEIGKVDFRKKDRIHRLVNMDNNKYKNIIIELKKS